MTTLDVEWLVVGVRVTQAQLAYRTLWTDEIRSQDGASSFATGFLDLGVDAETVQQLTQRYQQASEHVRLIYSVPAPRNFAGRDGIGTWFANRRDRVKDVWDSAIADIFRDREFLIEASERRRVEVPLFHLNSAPVKKSGTVYEEILSAQTEHSWMVTVFGSGMGATQAFKITYGTKLQSKDGQPKLVFVPITIVAYLIGAYEHGKRVGTGLRTEMAVSEDECWLPGVRSWPESAVLPTLPDIKVFREHFPLAGDPSKSIQSYSHTIKGGVEFEFGTGIQAFDLAAKSKFKIRQDRELKLTYNLPAGHDYEALTVVGLSGVWWRVL